MTEKPVYLTMEGQRKLNEELDYLTTVRRREVAAAIKSAKEEGDLSENSAYEEAKLAQGFLEGRIQTIQAQLRNAVLITDGNGANGMVSIGATVTVEEEEFGKETYTIVGSAEADPLQGRISNESPIGQALLGAKEGDQVVAETPGGQILFKVLRVE